MVKNVQFAYCNQLYLDCREPDPCLKKTMLGSIDSSPK